MLKNIYVDTGAFFALSDVKDTHHRRASEYTRRVEKQAHFVTSSYVVIEAWLLIRNKLGYRAALDFLVRVRGGAAQIRQVTDTDLTKAMEIMTTYADQEFSLVDAVSFVLMERLEIDTSFTFDAHFRIYRYGAKRERAFTVVP